MATSVSRRSPSSVHPTRQQLDDLDALLKRMLDLPVNRLEDEAEEVEDAAPPAAEARPGQETVPQQRPPTPASAPAPMRGPHRSPRALPLNSEAAALPSFEYNTPHADEADLKPRVIIVAPNAPENETNSTAEGAAYAPPHPAAETQADGRPEDWVPLATSWRPSSRTWKPLTEAWQQAQRADKEPERQELKETGAEQALVSAPAPTVQLENQSAPSVAPSPSNVGPLGFGDSKPTPRATSPAAASERTPAYLWPLVGFNAAFDLCLGPWGPIGRWLRGPNGRALLGILGLVCLTAAAALAVADWIGWTS